MTEVEFMREALELAKRAAALNEVPVGAVIVSGGKVIGRGFNRREELQDPLWHAEIEAIRQAAKALGSWRLSGCTLVCTLEPCPMCLSACQQARIDRLVFGAWDKKGGALSLGFMPHEDSRTNHRFVVEYRQTPECEKIISEFFKKLRAST